MYEYKVYGTAKFYVESGFYSLRELEEMVRQLKEAAKPQDEALRKSMGAKNV